MTVALGEQAVRQSWSSKSWSAAQPDLQEAAADQPKACMRLINLYEVLRIRCDCEDACPAEKSQRAHVE